MNNVKEGEGDMPNDDSYFDRYSDSYSLPTLCKSESTSSSESALCDDNANLIIVNSSSSEDSLLSSSSNNNEGTVSDEDPANKRRRSHRPRGCRGGRKNRKKLQHQQGGAVPQEIVSEYQPQYNQYSGWPLLLKKTSVVGSGAVATFHENGRRHTSRESAGQNDDHTLKQIPQNSYSSFHHPANTKLADILPPLNIPSDDAPVLDKEGPNPYALSAHAAPQQRDYINWANFYCIETTQEALAGSGGGSSSLFSVSPRTFLMYGKDGDIRVW